MQRTVFGDRFAVSVHDEHWQIQLVMGLSGWIINFQFGYFKFGCLGEGKGLVLKV